MEKLLEMQRNISLCYEHYLMYKAVFAKCNVTCEKETRQFLVLTANAHIQMSYLVFCKIFGSEKNNTLHFTNFVSEEKFYQELLRKYQIDKEKFGWYVETVKKFRDKYIAHADEYEEVVPPYEIAKCALVVFDELLEAELSEQYKELFGTLRGYIEVTEGMYSNVVERMVNDVF